MSVANPLLDFDGLPRFADIRIEHMTPALDSLLEACKACVATLERSADAPSWDRFVTPLEDANERLGRAWGIVGHLHGVLDAPELRAVYNFNQPKVVQYYTELGQNLALFGKYKALRASAEFSGLSAAQRRMIENEIRDFRLAGAELPDEKKKRFAAISEELAQLTTRFAENLLDATNAYALEVTDTDALRGVPDDVVATARALAAKDGGSGWKFTLHAPSYVPFMQYAERRDLREQMYRAYVTRASEFGKPEWDNTPLIRRILCLRREAAQLLGFRSHAEVSLEPKMAQSPAQVLDFLRDLARKARPYALKDYAELRDFAADELGLPRLEAWDLAYASEKLRAARYAFSDQEVKQYFQEQKVIAGMFRLVETLFGVRIVPDTAQTWDPSVRFFRVSDARGALLGQFYLDPYARDSKRGGAWMDEAMGRRRVHERLQTPVAYLNCNFSAPVGDRPALFTHDEVLTLFHEFGHGLHHLLTRVDYLGVSGLHGVEWDAVELPSQFLENFCWEWEVVAPMCEHVDSGAPLPRSLFDKMIAAKNFQSGMQMVRQLEFSLFDMHLHYDYAVDGEQTPLALLEAIRAEVAVAPVPAYNRFPNNFSHIFAGGYSAGYYSYKWAEVLSADAYAQFEEQGVLDPRCGQRFLDEILAVGGSRPALESFTAFRGREPRVDALLRHSGMTAAS